MRSVENRAQCRRSRTLQHAQVLEMWEQGRCYSPLGLFYTSVRDNYDPRSEGTVSEEMELGQVVRRATRLMQHQSQ